MSPTSWPSSTYATACRQSCSPTSPVSYSPAAVRACSTLEASARSLLLAAERLGVRPPARIRRVPTERLPRGARGDQLLAGPHDHDAHRRGPRTDVAVRPAVAILLRVERDVEEAEQP